MVVIKDLNDFYNTVVPFLLYLGDVFYILVGKSIINVKNKQKDKQLSTAISDQDPKYPSKIDFIFDIFDVLLLIKHENEDNLII